jgi:hypothetical protein
MKKRKNKAKNGKAAIILGLVKNLEEVIRLNMF